MRQKAINLIIMWFLIKLMTNLVLNSEINGKTIDFESDNNVIDNCLYELNDNSSDEEFVRPVDRSDQLDQSSDRHKRSKDSIDDNTISEMSSGSGPTDRETNQSTAEHSRRPPVAINCSQVLLGQYQCSAPAIDSETQQAMGCTVNNTSLVNCTLIPGLICESTASPHFQMVIECRHTNGYSYETALLLSIFLGMFGADRFYLGYPALGLLKFCTLGFLFLGQLIDIMLIAMQIVGPADGSFYVIKHFGPKLEIVAYNERTDIVYKDYNEW